MSRRPILILALALATVAGPNTARAGVILSNLNQSNANRDSSSQTGQAFVFGTPALSLDSIRITQFRIGPTAGESLTLNARNSNGSIGAPLLTFVTGAYDSATGYQSFTPAAPFVLTPTTGYWIVLTTPTQSNWDYTNSLTFTTTDGSSIPTTSRSYDSFGGGTYYGTTGGTFLFDISASPLAAPVPEPGSLAVLASVAVGGVGLRLIRRRRARA